MDNNTIRCKKLASIVRVQKCSTNLRQAKTGRHECRNITATPILKLLNISNFDKNKSVLYLSILPKQIVRKHRVSWLKKYEYIISLALSAVSTQKSMFLSKRFFDLNNFFKSMKFAWKKKKMYPVYTYYLKPLHAAEKYDIFLCLSAVIILLFAIL